MKISIGSVTDAGRYRKKNQDRIVAHYKRCNVDDLTVVCVCDGIGSFDNSEIAAEMMTQGITRWFEGIIQHYPSSFQRENLLEDLEITIQELNELIYEYRRMNAEDIGCTMSLLLILNQEYFVFHVGDSRIYCLRDALTQITVDEVSVKESQGKMKSVLANYVGKTEELWMNKFSGEVMEDDLFIAGSDGLYKRMTYEDCFPLKKQITNDKQAVNACVELINMVLDRGEKDNVSCGIVSVDKERRLFK